jgi:hypothetical protein
MIHTLGADPCPYTNGADRKGWSQLTLQRLLAVPATLLALALRAKFQDTHRYNNSQIVLARKQSPTCTDLQCPDATGASATMQNAFHELDLHYGKPFSQRP